MKRAFLLALGFAALTAVSPAATATLPANTERMLQTGIHPAEAKYDRLMASHIAQFKAAFAEPNDQKTMAMITKATDQAIAEMDRLFPEFERWVKGMSEADKEAFQKRAEKKPYIADMMKLMFDPKMMERLQKNPALQAHLEAQSKRMKKYEVQEPQEKEETPGDQE